MLGSSVGSLPLPTGGESKTMLDIRWCSTFHTGLPSIILWHNNVDELLNRMQIHPQSAHFMDIITTALSHFNVISAAEISLIKALIQHPLFDVNSSIHILVFPYFSTTFLHFLLRSLRLELRRYRLFSIIRVIVDMLLIIQEKEPDILLQKHGETPLEIANECDSIMSGREFLYHHKLKGFPESIAAIIQRGKPTKNVVKKRKGVH